jgi:hypothetical protein
MAQLAPPFSRIVAPRLSVRVPIWRTEVAWVAALGLLLGLISLLYLLETSSVATAGYDIQRLQAEQKQWELKNEQLQLEVAKLQSLAWVESRAAQLGMHRPDQTRQLQVNLPAPDQGAAAEGPSAEKADQAAATADPSSAEPEADDAR